MKKIFVCLFSLGILQAGSQDLDHINALKFKSLQEYDEFLEKNEIENLKYIRGYDNYVALETTFKTEDAAPEELDEELPDDGYNIKDDPDPVDDESEYSEYGLLGKLLSTDKVIIIGNWIVKINLESQKAFLLNTNHAKEYNDLLKENVRNSNVLQFSTSEDGAAILQELDKGTPVNDLRLWCSDRYAKREKSTARGYNGNRRRLDMKAVYQKAFIYFSLHGKGKCQKRFLRIWWRDWHGSARMYYMDLRYNARCKNVSFNFQGDPYLQPGFGAMISNQDQPTFRAYTIARAIKNYTYVIDFSSKNHGSGHVGISD